MDIVVFGGTGMIGSRIAAELEQRGHTVMIATRSTHHEVTDPASVAEVAAGADAVVSAVSARGTDYTLVDIATALTEGARRAQTERVLVVGGAGSLEVAPGVRLVDTPEFPDEWKPEALEQADTLEFLRGLEDLDWTYVSPAAVIHPGERTGRYRLGGDLLLVDEETGASEISAEDYAVAVADVLEHATHRRARVSVAW